MPYEGFASALRPFVLFSECLEWACKASNLQLDLMCGKSVSFEDLENAVSKQRMYMDAIEKRNLCVQFGLFIDFVNHNKLY